MILPWLAVVPAWGARHVELMAAIAVPALLRSAKLAGIELEIMVHTDLQGLVGEYLRPLGVRYHTLPIHVISRHRTLSVAHREAMLRAKPGQVLLLVNADMVCSLGALAAIKGRVEQGKRLIIVHSPRARWEDAQDAQLPGDGSALARWGWEHRHAWTEDCIWGRGCSVTPSQIHFEKDGRVVTRAFHLHPVAFVKHTVSGFTGMTIDDGLADAFSRTEVHIVTEPEELAFIELSDVHHPAIPSFHSPMTPRTVAAWALARNELNGPRVSGTHLWQFGYRVRVVGEPDFDCGDRQAYDEIVAMIQAMR